MKQKNLRMKNPLRQPPPEHFQPIEEDLESNPSEDNEPSGITGGIIPPLRHPFLPFWEEENGEF